MKVITTIRVLYMFVYISLASLISISFHYKHLYNIIVIYVFLTWDIEDFQKSTNIPYVAYNSFFKIKDCQVINAGTIIIYWYLYFIE